MKCTNKECAQYNPEWLYNCTNSVFAVLRDCPGFKPEDTKNTLIYDGMNTQLGRPQTCPQCGQRNPSGYNLPQDCISCGKNSHIGKKHPGGIGRTDDGGYICESCGKKSLRLTEGAYRGDKFICNACMREKSAATPEPEPTGNGDVVLFDVLQDILSRAQVGKEKYGTYLRTGNGRDALVDAYEEAIDLAMYLKQRIMEEEKDGRD